MISWMAGILYLLRLFVYHSKEEWKSEKSHAMLCVMERKLFVVITRPAMALTWLSGLGMAGINHSVASSPWFMLKLSLVVLLTFVTELAGATSKRLKKQLTTNDHSPILPTTKKLLWINEIPTLLMMIIIYLVIFRPFMS